LGQAETVDAVEVRWPSGVVQVVTNVKTDQVIEVREPPRP
jgi:hypothetical protein